MSIKGCAAARPGKRILWNLSTGAGSYKDTDICTAHSTKPACALIIEDARAALQRFRVYKLGHGSDTQAHPVIAGGTQDFQVDLAEKVAWAESNPDRVEAIVREANAFAARYLSKRGQQCFAIQLLNEYANLLKDPWELRRMKRRGQHIRVSAKDGWS